MSIPTPPHSPQHNAPDAQSILQPISATSAGAEPTSTSYVDRPPVGSVVFERTDALTTVKLSSWGERYNFRQHADVQRWLQDFAYVELIEVRVFVFQCNTWGFVPAGGSSTANTIHPSTASLPTIHIRLGIAPGTTSITNTTTGSSTPSVETNGHGIVHLESFLAVPLTANSAEYCWGANGRPFPPGLQTDLRAIQLRHAYPTFVMVNLSKSDSRQADIVAGQIRFAVRCWGQNYGPHTSID